MALDDKIFEYKARDFVPVVGLVVYGQRVDNSANAALKEQGLRTGQHASDVRPIRQMSFLLAYNVALLQVAIYAAYWPK